MIKHFTLNYKHFTLMKKYIFTIAFALLGITSSMASKADTLRIYSIDGERIPNFTGKELIGKTIKNYQVNTNVLPAPKRDVIEIHIITTTTPPAPKPNPHYLIKGREQELTEEEFNKISPSKIRAIDPKVLIFFLTDRTEKNDRLKGFSLKANDYLAKPFYPEELLARIEERFSMNESETIEEEVYHFGETTFCYNNNELRTRSSRVLITSRQADILRLLAKNIGNVVSKEMIQEAVWGTVSYANSLAVNVQMTYLRHALQHDATVKIESLKKKGYVLSVISPE
jgi:DNA-binding winged helix-turn-helix (wHTH) protein